MFVLQERGAEEEHTLNFTVPITEPLPPQHLEPNVSQWEPHCATHFDHLNVK